MLTGLFWSFLVSSQNITIYTGNQTQWIIVRQLYGEHKRYLFSLDNPGDGVFRFSLKKYPPGEYAVQFNGEMDKILRFIYNYEDIVLKVDGKNFSYPGVVQSKENSVYIPFLKKTREVKKRYDELRDYYADTGNPVYQIEYENLKREYMHFLTKSLKDSEGKLVFNYISQLVPFLPNKLYRSKKLSIQMAEEHFLDWFHPDSKHLIRSGLIMEKVNDYVFGIPILEFGKNRTDVYKKRVAKVLAKAQVEEIKAQIIFYLLKRFSTIDKKVLKTLEAYHNRLPERLQDPDLLQNFLNYKAPVVGNYLNLNRLADNKKLKLKKANYYLVIFQSPSCQQCGLLLPKLNEQLKTRGKVEVVNVSFEDETELWKNFNQTYKKWKNIQITTDKLANIIGYYRLQYLPTVILADKHFVILEKIYGQNDILEMLKHYELLKK